MAFNEKLAHERSHANELRLILGDCQVNLESAKQQLEHSQQLLSVGRAQGG